MNIRSLPRDQPRACQVKSEHSTDDWEGSPCLVKISADNWMCSENEIRNRRTEQWEEQERVEADRGVVRFYRRDKEDEGHKTPSDQVDTDGERISSYVATVGTFDVQWGNQEHGIAEPEGPKWTVRRHAEGISDAKFHDANNYLDKPSHEDG